MVKVNSYVMTCIGDIRSSLAGIGSPGSAILFCHCQVGTYSGRKRRRRPRQGQDLALPGRVALTGRAPAAPGAMESNAPAAASRSARAAVSLPAENSVKTSANDAAVRFKGETGAGRRHRNGQRNGNAASLSRQSQLPQRFSRENTCASQWIPSTAECGPDTPRLSLYCSTTGITIIILTSN